MCLCLRVADRCASTALNCEAKCQSRLLCFLDGKGVTDLPSCVLFSLFFLLQNTSASRRLTPSPGGDSIRKLFTRSLTKLVINSLQTKVLSGLVQLSRYQRKKRGDYVRMHSRVPSTSPVHLEVRLHGQRCLPGPPGHCVLDLV